MPEAAHIRAERVHNLDGQRGRRAAPEDSGALVSWGAEWERIVELLAEPIGKTCPEVRSAQTIWLLRAQRAADDRVGRLPAPDGSGARACWSMPWGRVLSLISGEIERACPELRGREVWSIVRARSNGVRIEFFLGEDAWKARRRDPLADIAEGPPIGAARVHIEFFDDEDAFTRRLENTVAEVDVSVGVHGGRLTWM